MTGRSAELPTAQQARRTRRARLLIGVLCLLALLLASVAALLLALNRLDEAPLATPATPFAATPQRVQRGAYLALAGNCAGCHTARGGASFAGGSGIATPFGTVYASNLTPDRRHGIGAWNSDDFWRALHNGRSRDGHLLYPAFPYPNYTAVARGDADALFAYLQSLPAVAQPNTAHALRFPYDRPAALMVWRAVFFRPGTLREEPSRSPEWNRGRYLVQGLGHCSACHAARNGFGASSEAQELGGGLIPVQNWYAPSLHSGEEAGVADWSTDEIVELLRTGRSARGSVSGPMADVVFRSTQHLNDDDLRAIAVFLKALPRASRESAGTVAVAPAPARSQMSPAVDAQAMQRGAGIYRQRCADCHGEHGEGATGAYPPLAGNHAVQIAASPANLIQMVVHGGYLPSTAGNPRPYGMPPFGPVLDDTEIAAVVTYVRNAWGNTAPPVSTLDVLRLR